MNKITISAFLFLIAAMIEYGCDKDEARERDHPQIRTNAVNNISPDGARFNGSIISGDVKSITEYGFVWGTGDYLSLETSERLIVHEVPDGNTFSYDITFALEAMREYQVRSYVKSGNYTIYGDAVTFMSLGSQAPVITDFEPKSATWGDTITIYGENFSYRSGTNVVLFGEKETLVLEGTNEMLRALVPNSLVNLTSYISVEVLGNRSTSTETFSLISPVIVSSASPALVAWLDTLRISGEFPDEIALSVTIDKKNCQIACRNPGEIGVIIPVNLLNYNDLYAVVTFNGHSLMSPNTFKLRLPFASVNASFNGDPGDQVTVNGLFNPITGNNSVVFSTGQQATITSLSRNTLEFTIPEIMNGFHPSFDLTSGTILVLDNQPFTYTLPEVTSLTPESGNQYEKLVIEGNGFVYGQTLVYLGSHQLGLSFISPTELHAYMPESIESGTYSLSVKVYDHLINTGLTYTVIKPRIIDFSPKEATYGDMITIGIEAFFEPVVAVYLYPAGNMLEIVSTTSTEIKALLPDYIGNTSNTLVVSTSRYSLTASDPLVLKKPFVQYYPELAGRIGQTFFIEAMYISPNPYNYQASIGGRYIPVQNITGSGFEIVIPAIPQGIYPINLKIADYEYIITNQFTLSDAWSSYSEKPRSIFGNTNTGYFLIGNKVYIATGTEYYSPTSAAGYFDIENKTWANIMAFPGTARNFATGWAINNSGYVGFGYNSSDDQRHYKDIYKYDPGSDNWSAIANPFPGEGRRSPFSFTVNGKAYVGGGFPLLGDYFTDLYEFDPDGETWTRKADLPEGYNTWIKACTVNNKGYVHTGRKIFVYDPANDTWETRVLPANVAQSTEPEILFTMDHYIYFIANYSHPTEFWRYDVDSDSWKELTDMAYGYFPGGIGFAYEGMGYYGLGQSGNDNYWLYKYNPLLEP